MTAGDLPCSLNTHLPAQYAEERPTIRGPGGSAPNKQNRRSPWANGGGPSPPHPDGNPPADNSASSHTS